MRASPLHCRAFAVVAGALVLAAGPVLPAKAYLEPDKRQALDLSAYKVNDKNASFFDIAARMTLLAETKDPQLVRMRNKLGMSVSCNELMAQPVMTGRITLPSFYDNPGAWQETAAPLLAFEQRMSKLSGAWVATGDAYYANCLVNILAQWAEADALHEFKFSTVRPQAWYGIESMIFSAALAFSTVTGEVEIAPERRKAIEQWLIRISRNHFAVDGPNPSCCNNHYYRRALYMTTVGVVTGNDEIFRTGLRSVFSALHDMNAQGAFGLAMKRGWRAIHYHNYSLLYLVMTMQVAYHQGYNLFEFQEYGHNFKQAVAFLLRALRDPYGIEGLPSGEQDLTFTNDVQYIAWMEIWLSHFDNPEMERFVRLYREEPIFNRGAGGYLTFFFKRPEDPSTIKERQFANLDARRLTAAEAGARYPYLAKWRRSQ